eukprot:5710929-Pleurochrysis_carterae.AAC.1
MPRRRATHVHIQRQASKCRHGVENHSSVLSVLVPSVRRSLPPEILLPLPSSVLWPACLWPVALLR